MRDIIQELHDKVKDDLTELDVDSMYDEMLDECYDLSEVGGPFTYMLASKVLEECDPVAYRCGFTDWLDGESLYEVDGEYYHSSDLEGIKDELIGNYEDEIADLQTQLDEINGDEDRELSLSQYEAEVDRLEGEIAILEEYLVELRKHVF